MTVGELTGLLLELNPLLPVVFTDEDGCDTDIGNVKVFEFTGIPHSVELSS